MDDRESQDERGMSVSTFVAVVVVGLIIMIGLVVDGAQQTRATSRAESVAAAAARAAGNRVADGQVSGAGSGDPLQAARAVLDASSDVQGEAWLVGGRVEVTTRSTRETVFLSLVGIDSVTGTGSAQAEVVPVTATGGG